MQLKSRMPEAADGSTLAPPLAVSAALEGGPRSEPWDKVRYVLGHPVHLVTLCALALSGLFLGSAWVLVPILAFEILCARFVPRLRFVERRVERRRRERRRTMAARARAGLIAYMEPIHGRELTELERRAQTARAYAASAGEAMEVLLDDWYGLDRLLGTYVRLSIAHRSARESASLTDRDQICREIQELEMQRGQASSARVRRLLDRELTILRARAACLERNEEEREALAREIASIAGLCRLIQERTVTLASCADLHGEVERLVADAELQDQALDEAVDEADSVANLQHVRVRVAATDPLEELMPERTNVMLKVG